MRPRRERAPASTPPAEVDALRLLARVAVLANEAPALEPCLAGALREICEHGGWDAGHAWLVDASGALVASGVWHLADAHAFEPLRAANEALRLALRTGLPGAVAASDRPFLWREGEPAPDVLVQVPSRVAAARACGIRSGFAFPVRIGRETAGVLEFFSRELRELGPTTVDVLAQVGLQLGRVVERERATAALAGREAQLRALLRSLADDFVCVVDRDGRIVDAFGGRVNERWGYRFGAVAGQRPIDYLPRAQAERVHAGIEEVFASGEPRVLEQSFDVPSLGPRFFAVSLYPVPGADGRVERVLTASRDVTERYEAERALRESERRFEALADAVPVGIARLDARGHCFYRNEQLRRMTGFSDEEMAGERWLEAFPPRHRERAGRRMRDFYADPAPSVDEHPMRCADGSERWVLTRTVPERDADGRVVGFVCCVLDISERKAVEEALRQSEHRIHSLAEALPVGIWRTDAVGRFADVNRRMGEFLDVDMDAALGRDLVGWLRERSAEGRMELAELEAAVATRARSIADRVAHEFEFLWRRRDGAERWFQMRAEPEFDADGTPVGRVGTLIDVTERRRAEDALRESERRYHSLAEAVPAGVWRNDATGRLVYMNRRQHEFVGLAPETEGTTDSPAMVARLVAEGKLDGAEAARLTAESDEAFATRHAKTVEMRVCGRDGRERWLQLRIEPEFDATGRFAGFVGASSDVTDLKRIADALRESEQRFESLAEALPVGVFRSDADGRSLYENRRLVELLDIEPTERLGPDSEERFGRRRAVGRMDADEAASVLGGFAAAVRARDAFSVEYRWRLRDGTLRWLQLRAVPEYDARGVFVGHVGTIADTTERRLAEQALRESEHRFHTLAESLPVGVWRTDAQGRLVYENRRMRELLEERGASLLGSSAAERAASHVAGGRLAAHEGATLGDDFERAMRRHEPSECELRWLTRGGELRWLHMKAQPEFDAGGNFVGHVGTLSDVTERRLAEQELARHRDHLGVLVAERTAALERSHEALRRSERLAAVGTFAAGIAHQINNPVGGILLAAQFAQEALGDRERIAQSLSDIEQDAKHVGRIVRGVLEFARGPNREPAPCDLNAVVAACAGSLRRDGADRGTLLELALADGLPPVLGSETALEQVVTNLVWNAIEAGASVVRVRTVATDDGVALAVEDDGQGIAPEDLERVFDPLFTTRARRGGTGLGLALAHGIVHAHGGRIALSSRRGEGTTVSVRLPRA